MRAFAIICGMVLTNAVVMEIAAAECEFKGQKLAVGTHNISCGVLTCHSDGTSSAVGCGDYACPPGKQIGYKDRNDSKVYPECCGGPICAE